LMFKVWESVILIAVEMVKVFELRIFL
jgi:hypothetical protein